MGKNPTHLVQRGGREKLRRQRVGCGGGRVQLRATWLGLKLLVVWGTEGAEVVGGGNLGGAATPRERV